MNLKIFFVRLWVAIVPLVSHISACAEEIPRDAKIYVAGHRGLVGSAIVRLLKKEGYTCILTRTSTELDLRRQGDVFEFFDREKPDYVFLAAAKVGGIKANSDFPADFIFDNLMIQTNVIHAAYLSKVKKLLLMGSSCVYPRDCPQPIHESYLLDGKLEETNRPYAIAKIAGIELCRSYNRQYGTKFISCMPTNLYGPNDLFDLQRSHVMPALIRKFYEGRKNRDETVSLWGTGTPRREFLHSDDLARACLCFMRHYEGNEPVNIGTGEDLTIAELAEIIREETGFRGEIVYDPAYPDGTMRKVLNVDKIFSLGWRPEISLREGIRRVIGEYSERHSEGAP